MSAFASPPSSGADEICILMTAAQEGKRLVVLGSSFISMELVAAVAKRGLASIDVVGMEEFPFQAVLGKEVGAGLKKVNILSELSEIITRSSYQHPLITFVSCRSSTTNPMASNSTCKPKSTRSSPHRRTPPSPQALKSTARSSQRTSSSWASASPLRLSS